MFVVIRPNGINLLYQYDMRSIVQYLRNKLMLTF